MAGIVAERIGNRIHVTGWLGPDTPAMCKAVGAGRFSKRGGAHWTFPLATNTCRRLRTVFGERLAIGAELETWAWEAFAADRELTKLGKARSATLSRVPSRLPAIARAMESRPYQQACAKFIGMSKNVLVADQPGLGKTIEIIAGLCESRDDDGPHCYVIFCPRVAVRSVWEPELLERVGPDTDVVCLLGTKARRTKRLAEAIERSKDHDVYVITLIESARIKPTKTDRGVTQYHMRDAYYPQLFTHQWTAAVVDESDRALIRVNGKNNQQRAGFMQLTKNTLQRIAASGTPMRGKPEQLFGTLQWLRPREYTSYWNWVKTYYEVGNNGFTEYDTVIGKLKRPNALAHSLRSIMIRRTKAEVLPELPPKQYAGSHLIPGDELSPYGVWLEMGPKQAKQYATMVSDGVVEGENGELLANGVLAENTRKKLLAGACGRVEGNKLLPILESEKFDWVENKLAQLGHFNEPHEAERIIIVSQFTVVLDMYDRELTKRGLRTHKITGKVTSDRARANMIKDFQSDKPTARIFLLNTKAAGVAITLDMADYLVILDETSIPDNQEQVEDRAHRTSRIHQLTVYYLRTRDTIEEEIAWMTAARENVQKHLLDGTRGVIYAKNLYKEKFRKVPTKSCKSTAGAAKVSARITTRRGT